MLPIWFGLKKMIKKDALLLEMLLFYGVSGNGFKHPNTSELILLLIHPFSYIPI